MTRRLLQQIDLGDGTRVVVVDVLGNKSVPTEEANRNIYRLNGADGIIWQVQVDPGIYERAPFTGLQLEGGRLVAYRWDGVEYVLDIATGRAVPTDFVR
jgi:hypothetical protein